MDNYYNKLIEILIELGYRFTKVGENYRSAAIYRKGSNPTSLSVNLDKNAFYDFVTLEGGSLEKLICLTLGIDVENCKKYVISKYGLVPEEEDEVEEKIIKPSVFKSFNESILNSLKKDYSYWNNRGISSETLDVFECGLCNEKCKLNNRFCFPIFNINKEIVGIAGRDVTGNNKIKWINFGKKSNWVYPVYFNRKDINDKKSIILVESIGDMLSLYESGIKNSVCLFGLNLSLALLNYIIRINTNKIIISTNFDENTRGQESAVTIKHRLEKYFSKNKIKITHPIEKDFNEMLIKKGKNSIRDLFNEQNSAL